MRGMKTTLKTWAFLIVAGIAGFTFLHCSFALAQPVEELKSAEEFQCTINNISISSQRSILYQQGDGAVTQRGNLNIAFFIYGPEGATLWAARNVKKDGNADLLAAAIDDDGNDLRDPESRPNLWPNYSYSSRRSSRSQDAPVANYQLTLKVPPTGSQILTHLEGRIAATMVVEEASVEVAQAKEHLDKGIELGDYTITFTSITPQEIAYTVTPKDAEMLYFLQNCMPIAITFLDGDGREMRSGRSGTTSGQESVTYRMGSFSTDVPDDVSAVIRCAVKTADIEIPYSFKNVRLPGATPQEETLRAEDLPVAEGYNFVLTNAYLNVNRSINYTNLSSQQSSVDRMQMSMNLDGPEELKIVSWPSDRNGLKRVNVMTAIDGDDESLLGINTRSYFNCREYSSRSKKSRPDEFFANLQVYLNVPPKGSAVLKELEGYVLATQVLEEDSFVVKSLNENLDKDFDLGDFTVRFSLKAPETDRLVCTFTSIEKDGEAVDLQRLPVAIDWFGGDGRELQLSRSRTSSTRSKGEWEFRLNEPFPDGGSAVITYAKKTGDVRIPFSFKDVRLPALGDTADDSVTLARASDLPTAEGYELELREAQYYSNYVNYQGGGENINENLNISMSLYGPLSPVLTRMRVPGLEQPLPSVVTVALDSEGKDLRQNVNVGMVNSRIAYPFGRWLPGEGDPIGDFNISLQNPPEEGSVIKKLEGYATAVQIAEEASIEVKPLKDNLDKDFEASDAIIRFTRITPEEVGYVISAKTDNSGIRRRRSPNELLVGVRWFDSEGNELQVTSNRYPGTDGEGRMRRTFGFREPFPEDGYATIVYVTKTTDVKIPFSFENIQLP